MKSKSRQVRLSALVAALALIAGCGGGGENSDNGHDGQKKPTKPIGISFSQSYVGVNDDSSFKLKGTFPEPDSVMIEQTPYIGLELIRATNGVVELSVPDMDRPKTTTLSITIKVAGREETNDISILARNISGESLVAKAETAISNRVGLLTLQQDMALYNFFVNYSYLAGAIRHSEKTKLLSEFNPKSETTYSNLSTVLTRLSSDMELYKQGGIGEDTLATGLSVVDAAVVEHGSYGAMHLRNIQSYVQVLVPSLAGGIIKYDEDLGIYSRFTVGGQYGAKESGQFVINDSYSPIESLIRVSPNQALTCEVL